MPDDFLDKAANIKNDDFLDRLTAMPDVSKKEPTTRQKVGRFLRPLFEGGGAVLGGIVGGGGAAVAGQLGPQILTPEEVVTVPLGALAGEAGGYAIGKKLADIVEGAQPKQITLNPFTNEVLGLGSDVMTGANYAMGGALLGRAIPPTLSALRHPVKKVKGLGERMVRSGAAKDFDLATTKTGPVAEQAARNAAETEALTSRVRGFQVGRGQATDDPQMLALQRRINMQSDAGKVFNAEQVMRNNDALRNHLKQSLPEGEAETVLQVLDTNRKSVLGAREQAIFNLDKDIFGMAEGSKQSAGATLKEGAETVKDALRGKAATLYNSVPENLQLNSTPLYDGIKREFAANDPEFGKIMGQLNNVMGRARSALEPQPNVILGADGLPYNQPRINADIPEAMTIGQLKNFRSQVAANMREARAAGNYDLARRYGNLIDDVVKTEDFAIATGRGDGINALREANKFYKEQYIPAIRQGATGRILATDKTGASRIDDALIGSEYFKPGAKGISAAESFIKTFGDNAAAKSALKDYAANDLLEYARNPVTNEIIPARVSRWLANHKDALSKTGLRTEFGSIAKSSDLAKKAIEAEAQYSKSRLATVLDQTDPDKAISYMFSGSNANNTAKTMSLLMNVVKNDPKAINGLKRAFADMLVDRMQTTAQDMAGGRMLSAAAAQKLMKQFEPAMKQLYTKGEMQSVKDIQRAIEIQSRIHKAPSGVAGSQTADLLATPTDMVRNYLPLDPKWRIMRAIFKHFKSGYDAQVNQYLARAMYDPKLANELSYIAREAKTGKAVQAATKLQANIDNAVASGLITGKAVQKENN